MMITRDDWNDALDAWVEEERERLGGPPSREEVVAYVHGELPPDEAARVRALLVYSPELTPLLTAKPPAVHRPHALRLYAVAATLVIALLTADAVLQRRRGAQPAVPSSHHELRALSTRSAAFAYELPAGQERYLLTIVPPRPPSEREYELRIARQSRVLWRTYPVHPVDGTFVLDVPGAFLEPGTYTLTVHTGDRLVERYPFRVVSPSRTQ